MTRTGVRPPAAEAGEWEEWMLAALAGDARAYDRLLRAVLPTLRGIAYRRLGGLGEAEDAVQDTLLTLHRLRHTWDPARPLRPWLAAICERRCVDRLRVATRLRIRQVPLGDLPEEAVAQEPTAPHQVARAELHAAVARLPRVQRTALALAKLEGLRLDEAAARSGLTPASLKVATHRAIRRLRLGFAAQPA